MRLRLTASLPHELELFIDLLRYIVYTNHYHPSDWEHHKLTMVLIVEHISLSDNANHQPKREVATANHSEQHPHRNKRRTLIHPLEEPKRVLWPIVEHGSHSKARLQELHLVIEASSYNVGITMFKIQSMVEPYSFCFFESLWLVVELSSHFPPSSCTTSFDSYPKPRITSNPWFLEATADQRSFKYSSRGIPDVWSGFTIDPHKFETLFLQK